MSYFFYGIIVCLWVYAYAGIFQAIPKKPRSYWISSLDDKKIIRTKTAKTMHTGLLFNFGSHEFSIKMSMCVGAYWTKA